MLERFLHWYRDTQASRACISKWAKVSEELTIAFYRHVEGYNGNKFADKVTEKFFRLYREGRV
jgi:hypothetical protein